MKGLHLIRLVACTMAITLPAALAAGATGPPVAVAPGSASGTVISSHCPAFSWGTVPGAVTYELVVYLVSGRDSATSSPTHLKEIWRVTLPGSAQSWTPSESQCLVHGRSYAWAVRAIVEGHSTSWSEASLFQIAEAPSVEEVRAAVATIQHFLLARRSPGSLEGGGAGWKGREVGVEEEPREPGHVSTRISEEKAGSPPPVLLSVTGPAATPALGTPSLSLDANVALGASSNVFKDGRVLLWNDTSGNQALGDSALGSVSGTATQNTAVGYGALKATTGGTPYFLGSYNTAIGNRALTSNTTGEWNTASGSRALGYNTTGYANTADGRSALVHNTTGRGNTASGFGALGAESVGEWNTGIGYQALGSTLGSKNTGVGAKTNTAGSGNVAIGYGSGFFASAPSNSIFISNGGASGDSAVIKIGTGGTQTKTFIAGIRGVTTGTADAISVVIDSNGQLGTTSSSRAVKQDIEDMGEVSDKLYSLRPVSFRYRKYVEEAVEEGRDPSKLPRTYGLIAEEVARVFPDLVVTASDGRPETIKYRLLAPLLLNELQKEHWTVLEQESELAALKDEVDALRLLLAKNGVVARKGHAAPGPSSRGKPGEGGPQ